MDECGTTVRVEHSDMVKPEVIEPLTVAHAPVRRCTATVEYRYKESRSHDSP